jgi:site-specific DNA-methyltransferase (adenine-specific)/modification methylase
VSFETVQIGTATLYRGDCMEVLPTLGRFDAVITDPPYGINESAGKAKTRTGPSSIGGGKYVRDYGNDSWDKAPINQNLINDIIAQAGVSVIFGGNYYDLPPTSCWLVWDKLNGDNDFADCELAWTNLPKAIRRLQFLWSGMLRANKEKRGDHPTQKPEGVMRWCIEQAGNPQTILDPFMGSGTTGVAAIQLGRSFTGIEREAKYFDIACERVYNAQRQSNLFPQNENMQKVPKTQAIIEF